LKAFRESYKVWYSLFNISFNISWILPAIILIRLLCGFEAIREIRGKNVTIVLVEQNVVFSLEISNRGYVLENGRIVMEGEGKELLLNEHIKKAYLAI